MHQADAGVAALQHPHDLCACLEHHVLLAHVGIAGAAVEARLVRPVDAVCKHVEQHLQAIATKLFCILGVLLESREVFLKQLQF